MDLRRRFELLTEEARGDREHGAMESLQRPGNPVGLRTVRVPGRGTTRLVRVMQTNACSLTCGYCPTFAGGTVRRATLAPEEVSRIFMDVKLLPGAEPAQVDAAVRLASRVSVNLEAPSDAQLRHLAREKRLSLDLLPKLERAGALGRALRQERRPGDLPRTGPTTQFVVGAAGERDREILGVVARLERERLLHHAHFSAFQPVAGTPLENAQAVPAVRETRLYQAEHLLRDYGFRHDELPFDGTGDLPLDQDPKTAWALRQRDRFPLAIETAPPDLLMRVPGIGPKTAATLVNERRRTLPRTALDLTRLGVDAARAAYFLTLRGRPLAPSLPPAQLRLFPPGEHLTHAAFKTPVPPCAYR